MTDVISVNSQTSLNAAIETVNQDPAPGAYENADYFIDWIFTEGDAGQPAGLYAINLQSGVTLTINGDGQVLSGGSADGGLAVLSGNVTIESLTIEENSSGGWRRQQIGRRRRRARRRAFCRADRQGDPRQCAVSKRRGQGRQCWRRRRRRRGRQLQPADSAAGPLGAIGAKGAAGTHGPSAGGAGSNGSPGGPGGIGRAGGAGGDGATAG